MGGLQQGSSFPIRERRSDRNKYSELCGIFLIPKKTGGFRPIINLKSLNKFLLYRHFRMEGIQTLRHIVRKGDWLAKIDLKDAYLTVPIKPDFRKFLCFKWEGKFYSFVSMPFGLASAPRAFTKLLRPVAAFLRKEGFRLVVYLDDILILATSKEEARAAIKKVRALLESLGFVISSEKSVEEPSQIMEYIGLVIHSVPMSFTLTEKKISDIKRLCQEALNSNKVPLRDIAKILGNFNWATSAVRFAQAHFRSIQSTYNSGLKDSNGDYQCSISLNPDAKDDLYWWISHANFADGKRIAPASPSLTIFSDASKSGWGLFVKMSRPEDLRLLTRAHFTLTNLSF